MAKQAVALLVAKTIGVKVSVYPDKIVISRSGLGGGSRGDKHIPLSSITSVQIKKPGLTAGYIRFGILGAIEGGRGWSPRSDENCVVFSVHKTGQFSAVRDLIEKLKTRATASAQAADQPQQQSIADQIRELSKLKDDGLITEAEFEAKKKSLLGL